MSKKKTNKTNEGKKTKLKEFSDESLKGIAKEIVVKRTALLVHFLIYVIVNALLVIINYATNGFENGLDSVWAIWSITGWGIGLLIHCLYFLVFKAGIVNYSSIAAIYHSGVFVIVEGFLIFVDWLTDAIISWSYWPLITWGSVVLAHIIFVFLFLPRKHKNDEGKAVKKSWMDRKVDLELQKIKDKGEK